MARIQDYIKNHKTYIIAEMSGNHGGSLEKALEIVRAAAETGADCLKTQTYTADTLTLNAHTEPFLLHNGLWDNSYLYDLYEKAYTPWEWMPQIKAEAERLGMDFLSTPFDDTAVDFLESIGEEFYKIASFELVDIPLIRKTALTGKPMVMSCGMASEEEIREAVETCYAAGNHDVILLKCCSAYPTDYATMHLNTIKDMQAKYDLPIGLSDHSEGSLADITAVALGACVIEKHFCISKEDNMVDSAFSLSKEEFAQMVQDIRRTEAALGGVSYGPAPEEAQRYSLRRSLYAAKDIKAGEAFTKENIRSVRPAGGLHTRYYDWLLGNTNVKPDEKRTDSSASMQDAGQAVTATPRVAAHDIPFGTPLSWDDVEGGDQT